MPLLTLYPGNVYWVDSNGGGGSKGTFSHPVATLAAAHALVTTDNGDIICIKPGHAETYTATVDFSKSGFAIVGLGFGDNRPTFTNGITAAGDDAFDFAGDDVVVYNIKWAEAAPAGSTVVVFNVSGDNFHIENCYIEMGAKTLTFLTHDTTGKKGLSVIGNTIVGTAAGPDVGVRVETTHLYAHIANNRWLFDQSAGIDTGVVVFVSGTTAAGEHLIDGDIFHTAGNADVYLVQTDVQSMSLCMNVRVIAVSADTALGASPASGFGFIDCFVTQEGAGVPALADHAGARPAATTPALT
jgi:hypothetical protein